MLPTVFLVTVYNQPYLIYNLISNFIVLLLFTFVKYHVIASNMAGDSEHEFSVTLKAEKPSIRKMFDRFAEIVEGEKLELCCILDGSPIPNVQWYKDSEKLVADEQYVMLNVLDIENELYGNDFFQHQNDC